MRRKLTGLYDRIFHGSRRPSRQATREWRRLCRWELWFSSSLLRYRELSAVSVGRGVRLGQGFAGPAAKPSRQLRARLIGLLDLPISAWRAIFHILLDGIDRLSRSL